MVLVPITDLPEVLLETVMVPVLILKVHVEVLVTNKIRNVNRVNLHVVLTNNLQEAVVLKNLHLHMLRKWRWTQHWNVSSITRVTHKVQTVSENSQFLEFSADPWHQILRPISRQTISTPPQETESLKMLDKKDFVWDATGVIIKQVYAKDILDLAQLLVEIACTSSTRLSSASSIPKVEVQNHQADLEAYLGKND